MNKKLLLSPLVALALFCSCNSEPSKNVIKKKILLEFVCRETAKVNNLKINDTKEAEAISGKKGFQYSVSGEVEWENGCKEFGTQIAPGFKEVFENKTVYLINVDGKWQ